MKQVLIVLFLNLSIETYGSSVFQDTTGLDRNTMRVLAEVISVDDQVVLLKIDSVVDYGPSVITSLNPGDEIVVRLPGQSKPSLKTKILADLREKMDVGALPSVYLLLVFKTIE